MTKIKNLLYLKSNLEFFSIWEIHYFFIGWYMAEAGKDEIREVLSDKTNETVVA